MPRTKSPAKRSSEQEPAWSIPSLREPRYSQSLERGLAILGCFTPSRPVLGIADIADELGMSRSTTHRYVITLVALGYLEQGASRKYRLGLRVTDLGMSALNSTGLREHARPYLEELRQRTSYTASLGVLDGMRRGFTRVPLYSLLFHCRATGGSLALRPFFGFLARVVPSFSASSSCRTKYSSTLIRVRFWPPSTPYSSS